MFCRGWLSRVLGTLVLPMVSYSAKGRTVCRTSAAASGVSNIEVFPTVTLCAKGINVCPITTFSQCVCAYVVPTDHTHTFYLSLLRDFSHTLTNTLTQSLISSTHWQTLWHTHTLWHTLTQHTDTLVMSRFEISGFEMMGANCIWIGCPDLRSNDFGTSESLPKVTALSLREALGSSGPFMPGLCSSSTYSASINSTKFSTSALQWVYA